MKTEPHNGWALQDYIKKNGYPQAIKIDNTSRGLGDTWLKHCRTHCFDTMTTEPNKLHQNLAEQKMGYLVPMYRMQCEITKFL